MHTVRTPWLSTKSEKHSMTVGSRSLKSLFGICGQNRISRRPQRLGLSGLLDALLVDDSYSRAIAGYRGQLSSIYISICRTKAPLEARHRTSLCTHRHLPNQKDLHRVFSNSALRTSAVFHLVLDVDADANLHCPKTLRPF